jgi:hypothetical protein
LLSRLKAPMVSCTHNTSLLPQTNTAMHRHGIPAPPRCTTAINRPCGMDQ